MDRNDFETYVREELSRLSQRLDMLFSVLQSVAKSSFNEHQIMQEHTDKRFGDLLGLFESLIKDGYLRQGTFSGRAGQDIKYTFRYLRNTLEKEIEERRQWRETIRDEWHQERRAWAERNQGD